MDGRTRVMTRVQRTVTVFHQQGLHARPAALFVQTAKRFDSRVTVKKGRRIVDGKSIMGLLTLAANAGSRIVVLVDGADAADAEEALEQLCDLVTKPLPDPAKPSHHK